MSIYHTVFRWISIPVPVRFNCVCMNSTRIYELNGVVHLIMTGYSRQCSNWIVSSPHVRPYRSPRKYMVSNYRYQCCSIPLFNDFHITNGWNMVSIYHSKYPYRRKGMATIILQQENSKNARKYTIRHWRWSKHI